MSKLILALVGPTASGKSAVALCLAALCGGEILCMDSMQVYRGCDIGTAKPTKAEQSQVPHHLLDICDPEDNFSVSDYQEQCEPLLHSVHVPILVGGTGLYLDSLMYRQRFGGAKADEALRAYYHRLADDHGKETLHDLLRQKDPAAAERLHPNDVRRVIRALEVLEATGRSITEENGRELRDDLRFLLYAIDRPRENLYARINRRVDQMIEDGLEAEVRALWERGVPKEATAIQGLGYKEFYDCFAGKCTREDARVTIKTRTRHYAKRQLTWFRRIPEITWLPPEQPQALARKIADDIERSKESQS